MPFYPRQRSKASQTRHGQNVESQKVITFASSRHIARVKRFSSTRDDTEKGETFLIQHIARFSKFVKNFLSW